MRYHLSDGSIYDDEAVCAKSWPEGTCWDGRNLISLATGSQWHHQRVVLTRRGRWVLEEWSDWQGSTPQADLIGEPEAARWILLQGHALPESLHQYADDLEA